MAHSTWSQALAWPSGQLIAPDGSCNSAGCSPVVRTSSAVRMPATAGTPEYADGAEPGCSGEPDGPDEPAGS